MKQTNENIIVQLASPERKYVKVYHDFLDNSFLTTEEQMIFIVLKSYVDFKEDSGKAYPSMETICKRAKMSEKRARKNINALMKKGIVKKIQRGLTKTNLYTLSDCATMWACNNAKDVAVIANNQSVKFLTPVEHIAELERMGYTVTKEREPVSRADQSIDTSTQINYLQKQDTTLVLKSQDLQKQERYALDEIKQLFEYDIMLQDNPCLQKDIDSVMDILHTIMNTTKPTIRIGSEDKPNMVVIGKLMKLNKESIVYAINKFSEQTEKIRNPAAYMLTILYNAPEQFNLYIQNQLQYNMHNWDNKDMEYERYDYADLERQLLNSQI